MAHRTLLTSFDINSLWHRMPFSLRCRLFFLIWCDLVGGAGDGGVMDLSSVIITGHYRCYTQTELIWTAWLLLQTWQWVFLCQFCPNHRVFSGFLTDLTLDLPWRLRWWRRTVQVSALTWRAIITARQAISFWGEEARNSGPSLSSTDQSLPQPCLTPKGELLL